MRSTGTLAPVRLTEPNEVAVEQGARTCTVTVRYMNHTRQ